MRKIILLCLCFVTVLFFIVPTVAHPGRTDSDGGHTNHSTGDYHFHHGYPEHEHENGYCPYDEDIAPSTEDIFNAITCFLFMWILLSIGTCKLSIGEVIISKIKPTYDQNGNAPFVVNIILGFLVAGLCFLLIS